MLTPATIGSGTKIWQFTHVMTGAKIGADCSLGQNVFVAATARIGDGCKIQNNVSIYDGVTIEDAAFIGPSVVFTNVLIGLPLRQLDPDQAAHRAVSRNSPARPATSSRAASPPA